MKYEGGKDYNQYEIRKKAGGVLLAIGAGVALVVWFIEWIIRLLKV